MKRADLAGLPDLAGETPMAGPTRSRRPLYMDLIPPCNVGCPAGENIQSWLALLEAGQAEAAWRKIVEVNPFPAIEGRVCYHPCETACNRAELDSAVSIHAVERYLGDLAIARGWGLPAGRASTAKRVLVVGAGPSGLSAAYHLARSGHRVDVADAGGEPGGMMRYGIPAYRLPRTVLDSEIARLVAFGVSISCNDKVTNLEERRIEGGFDATFVAVGAHLSKKVDIPNRDAGRILEAVSFLREVASGGTPVIGRRVAVYGGGNTAMDAARTARRLGASEAVVVYRRTADQMGAHPEEAAEAQAEGVKINWLRSINAFEGDDLLVEVMELDSNGIARPTGSTERLAADSLILAVGQDADTSFLRQVAGVEFNADGTVVVSDTMMTGHSGVFAGGDMVPAERTVTVGVGHGKKAARHIDAWLRNSEPFAPFKAETATFDKLHLWYFADADRLAQPQASLEERLADFTEVTGGFHDVEARFEAARCLSCGNCFECDGCLGACPEDAVIKLGVGHRYRFDYDRCTGCAVCFEQCPVHAIAMIPEPAFKAVASTVANTVVSTVVSTVEAG